MSWVGKNGIWALLKVVGLTPGLAVLQGQQPLWRKKGVGRFLSRGWPTGFGSSYDLVQNLRDANHENEGVFV